MDYFMHKSPWGLAQSLQYCVCFLSLLYKLPQTQEGGFKAQRWSLTVHKRIEVQIRVNGPKMELLVGRAVLPQEALRSLFPGLFWLLVAASFPWLVAPSLPSSRTAPANRSLFSFVSPLLCVSGCQISVCPSLIRTLAGCMQGPPEYFLHLKILHYICKVFSFWDSYLWGG